MCRPHRRSRAPRRDMLEQVDAFLIRHLRLQEGTSP